MEGIVYKSTGSNSLVKTAEGQFINCTLKGALKQHKKQSTSLVVVGDRVVVDLESDDKGVIINIHKRDNVFVRRSVNLSKRQHILAANIDLVLLLVTLEQPKTYETFIDRVLVAAEARQIRSVLVFNKVDRYNSDELITALEALIQVYEPIGYRCLKVSALKGTNIEPLRTLLKGKTVLITGVSGSGKSTLVKALDPNIDTKIGQVSEATYQGHHTTTFSQLFDLDFGARIIDTPGIKGFGIVDLERDKIGDYFPEFYTLKADCKYYNCLHLNEPDCAVLAAIPKGHVAHSRYKSYLNLLADCNQSRYR